MAESPSAPQKLPEPEVGPRGVVQTASSAAHFSVRIVSSRLDRTSSSVSPRQVATLATRTPANASSGVATATAITSQVGTTEVSGIRQA